MSMQKMEYIPSLYTGDDEPFLLVSYSHTDAEAVYADLAVLERRHVRFWYDYGIPPGPEWDRVVRGILEKPNCAGVLFYFSAASLASEAVQKEMGFLQETLMQRGFAYTPYFAVLLETDNFASLFAHALQKDPNRFLDAAGIITRLFTSKNLYIKHPRVGGAPVGPAYYDAIIKGVDVFGAREIDRVRGQYRGTPEPALGGITLYPAQDAVETERVLPAVLSGTRVVKIGEGAFRGDGVLYRVVVPWGVQQIGAGAFADCTHLTEVILPDTVLEIGEGAFAGCSALATLRLPEGLMRLSSHAFRDCSALTAIHLPDTLTALPSGCFRGCSALAEVRLCEGLTDIGAEAFYGCTALTEITFPPALVRLGREAFAGCTRLTSLVLPATVTEVNERVFAACTALRKVCVDAPREVIGRELFAGDTALAEVSLPDTVTEIRGGAFADCRALAAITLPAALTSLAEDVFRACVSLAHVELPCGLTRIGRRCFAGCHALGALRLPAALARIGAMAFMGCAQLVLSMEEGDSALLLRDGMLYAEQGTELVTVDATASKTLVIPEGTLVLRPGALAGSHLTQVTMPSSLTEIGQYVFFEMPRLTGIAVPDGVKRIGNGNFSACIALEQVTLPADCARFGGNLFRDLPVLTQVRYLATAPRELGLCCFSGVPALRAIYTYAPALLATLRGWEDRDGLIMEDV